MLCVCLREAVRIRQTDRHRICPRRHRKALFPCRMKAKILLSATAALKREKRQRAKLKARQMPPREQAKRAGLKRTAQTALKAQTAPTALTAGQKSLKRTKRAKQQTDLTQARIPRLHRLLRERRKRADPQRIALQVKTTAQKGAIKALLPHQAAALPLPQKRPDQR